MTLRKEPPLSVHTTRGSSCSAKNRKHHSLDGRQVTLAIVQVPSPAFLAAEVDSQQHKPLVGVVGLDCLEVKANDFSCMPWRGQMSGLGSAQVPRGVRSDLLTPLHNPGVQSHVCPSLWDSSSWAAVRSASFCLAGVPDSSARKLFWVQSAVPRRPCMAW